MRSVFQSCAGLRCVTSVRPSSIVSAQEPSLWLDPASASPLPDADRIEIWRTDELPDTFYSAGTPSLTADDLDEINALQHPILRDRAMRCRILLRWALSHRVAETVAPGEWRFTRSANGRLGIIADTRGLDFSISHSGTVSSIAIAWNCSVGIDLEVETDTVNPLEMVGYLHPREVRGLRMVSATQRPSAFFRLWTLKEAYSKLLGTGFAADFSSIAFAIDTARLIEAPIRNGGHERMRFSTVRLTQNAVVHHIALAVGNRSA